MVIHDAEQTVITWTFITLLGRAAYWLLKAIDHCCKAQKTQNLQ